MSGPAFGAIGDADFVRGFARPDRGDRIGGRTQPRDQHICRRIEKSAGAHHSGLIKSGPGRTGALICGRGKLMKHIRTAAIEQTSKIGPESEQYRANIGLSPAHLRKNVGNLIAIWRNQDFYVGMLL